MMNFNYLRVFLWIILCVFLELCFRKLPMEIYKHQNRSNHLIRQTNHNENIYFVDSSQYLLKRTKSNHKQWLATVVYHTICSIFGLEKQEQSEFASVFLCRTPLTRTFSSVSITAACFSVEEKTEFWAMRTIEPLYEWNTSHIALCF